MNLKKSTKASKMLNKCKRSEYNDSESVTTLQRLEWRYDNSNDVFGIAIPKLFGGILYAPIIKNDDDYKLLLKIDGHFEVYDIVDIEVFLDLLNVQKIDLPNIDLKGAIDIIQKHPVCGYIETSVKKKECIVYEFFLS